MTRPLDIAMIFGIFALVIVTMGFGIESVMDFQNYEGDDSFFKNVSSRVSGAEGLKGSADASTTALTGQEGASDLPSQDGIVLQGFNSIKD